jgi:asparagine synthase (glutamine-hydrolysing)
MCGIVGFQGRFDPALIHRMTDAVAHRGPDGQGSFVHDDENGQSTALGHRRLSIIDLSIAGAQPMQPHPDSAGGQRAGLTLVFNGEIYNFKSLRDELIEQGHAFFSRTDSEVLLHLYEQHGFAMLGLLNGIFAFAIHDNRENGRPDGVERGALFLVRDQLGVKPLYFAEIEGGVLFGSEIKALLEEPSLPRDIDHVALHNTLAYLWSPAPRTMLRAVRKLEPGCAMVVQRGRVHRKWTYFVLPYNGAQRSESERELSEELALRLRTAVERQLVSDVPVGAFLSGGLDSSAIVAMMRQLLPAAELTAFTIAFADSAAVDGNPNDLPYARRVAKHLQVNLREVLIDSSVINRLPELVSLLDEPQADPAPINALIIAEHARALGIPVLLSGAGGDDLFTGYRRHWALNFEKRWSWLPAFGRIGLQGVASRVGRSRGAQGVPALRRFAKMFAHAGDTADRRLVSYFLWSTDALRRGLYTDNFADSVADTDTLAPLLSSLEDIPKERDPLNRMLFLETRHFLADHNLNYTDRAGMAVGVEVRVPLLDLELVRFAANVPTRFKQKGRVGKAIFKKAMEPYLPRDVIYRPKSGFGVPLRRWLKVELRPMVEDTLHETTLRRRGIFRPAAVRQLIELDAAERVDGSYTIFAIMCIELWFRRFIDRDLSPAASRASVSAMEGRAAQ